MIIKEKVFNEINREYRITSKEIRKALGIEGEIININLFAGRTPTDTKTTPENDIWEIQTIERHKQ